jgi:hypothetical protein
MNKKQLISISIFILSGLVVGCSSGKNLSPKGIPDIVSELSRQKGELSVIYKGKEYTVEQYRDDLDFKYFSLQHWQRPNDSELPHALVLIFDNKGKLIKEIPSPDTYYAEMLVSDIDGDSLEDLILFWAAGMHSKYVEVWMRGDNASFKKVFELFNDKNIFFTTRNGVPAIASKKEYPMSASNNNFPDKDFEYYLWDGKTFVLKDEPSIKK